MYTMMHLNETRKLRHVTPLTTRDRTGPSVRAGPAGARRDTRRQDRHTTNEKRERNTI